MSIKSKLVGWLIRREIEKHVKGQTMFGKIWVWLSGKKTVIGAVISVLTEVVSNLSIFLPLFIGDANEIARIIGVCFSLLGLLHKAYKYFYNEEVKKAYASVGQVAPGYTDIANVQDVQKETSGDKK